MNKKEKDYLLYYLDQLSINLRNNVSEIQLGLSHIAEITKSISNEIPFEPKTVISNPLSTDKLADKPPESRRIVICPQEIRGIINQWLVMIEWLIDVAIKRYWCIPT